MITIEIKNSFSQLRGCPEGLRSSIEKALTYKDSEIGQEIINLFMQIKIAHRRRHTQKIAFFQQKIKELKPKEIVCLLKRDGTFPTGLLYLVQESLGGNPVSLVDLRKKPEKSVKYNWYSDFELRPYQKEALDKAITSERGVLELAIGSGKTLVAQHIVKALRVKSLIIVPAKDLKQQLMDSFADAFGSKDVCEITTASIKSKKALKPIRFVTTQTLNSLRKQGLIEEVTSDIDLICVDEAHHSASSMWSELLPYFDHVYYKYAFSGTYLRNDSKTLNLMGFCSNILYKYSPTEATKEGFLTPLEVKVHEVPGKPARNYNTEYSLNYCKNKELLIKVKEIFENHIPVKAQTLILVKQKDASGKILHEYLNEIGVDNVYVSGDSDKKVIKKALTDFNDKKIKVLIGSSVLGEGIDIRSTDHLIMLQGGKSEIQCVQNLGRCVRLFPGKKVAYVHDILFTNTKYLSMHAAKRLQIYDHHFEPKSIEII